MRIIYKSKYPRINYIVTTLNASVVYRSFIYSYYISTLFILFIYRYYSSTLLFRAILLIKLI